ncbi:S41 family peptidase [Aliidiomarina haloalkalitolerans]|nr:S41 family peptidase [Aliidiomarina haloalkalitolerans]
MLTTKQFLLTTLSAGLLAACGSDSVLTGDSPNLGNAQCSVVGQNQQLLSFMENRYLWLDDMRRNVNPANHGSIYQMLDALRAPQDIFSFILTESEYQERYIDAVFFGFGFGRRDRTDLGVIQITYVYETSPIAQAGVRRGDEITAVNGVSMATWFNRIASGQATWVDVFGPNEDGVEREFTWRRPDGTMLTETVRKTQVETNTVMAVDRFNVDGKEVGYYVFDSFINRSEDDLNDTYDQLIGVDELVIDLRYNGGGLVRVANQLASQAAWNNVDGEIFLTYQYNRNFNDEDYLFSLGRGIERLNLDRVYVLTTGASCSSSELVINSLKPFVEVVTIGQPTCGKPVGQQPGQICDKIVFAITFQTVNADGEGDYFDGLPVNCAASDTIVGDWGVVGDPLLDSARYHIANGQCPGTAGVSDVDGAMTLSTDETVSRGIPEQWQEHPLLWKWRHEH